MHSLQLTIKTVTGRKGSENEMPRVQRSPPKTSDCKISHAQSEPDVTTLSCPKKLEPSKVSTRTSKRPRVEDSPGGDFSAFKQEMIDLLNEWRQDQDLKLTKIAADTSKLKEQNEDIKKSYQEIEKSINFLSTKYDEVKLKLDLMDKERKEQKEYIMSLEKKVLDYEQSSRSSCIEVRNVPVLEMEGRHNITTTVSNIGKTIGMNIQSSDLRDSYRIPGKPGTCGPIIAEFASVNTKFEFLANVRLFNKDKPSTEKLNSETLGIPGQRTPIYITEHLNQSVKQLFYHARVFAKKNSFKFCWTTNGRIFLRKEVGTKQYRVHSEDCLTKIIQEQ